MGRRTYGVGDDAEGFSDTPYDAAHFVLTSKPPTRLPKGNVAFTFVTDGIESALEQARAAAGDKNVEIAGGAATVRQYLAAGLLDELVLHLVPVVLGAGERLLDGLSGIALEPTEVIASPAVTHLRYRVRR
jgi:dihydrofolate reductase